MKTCAVIPCYNEEKTIYRIVESTARYVDRVIVVDNCSKDDTIRVALGAGAEVFVCPIRGYGATLRTGIQCVGDADIVITLDGDGQHDPTEIPVLIEPLLKNEADAVIGSRFLRENTAPTYRRAGIEVINIIFNILGYRNKRILDTQSCYRAFRSSVFNPTPIDYPSFFDLPDSRSGPLRRMRSSVRIEEHGFGASTEILIKAQKEGYRIVEVPVSCIYHDKLSDNSTINPVSQGISVVWATVKWRILATVGRI